MHVCVCVFNPVIMTKSSYKKKWKSAATTIFLASCQDVLSLDLGKYACPWCTLRNFDTQPEELPQKEEEVSREENKQMTVTCESTPMTRGNTFCDRNQKQHSLYSAVSRVKNESHKW